MIYLRLVTDSFIQIRVPAVCQHLCLVTQVMVTADLRISALLILCFSSHFTSKIGVIPLKE